MEQGATRVNPSEETIKIGRLEIRFLLTGNDSNGSVSVFEVLVPVGQNLAQERRLRRDPQDRHTHAGSLSPDEGHEDRSLPRRLLRNLE